MYPSWKSLHKRRLNHGRSVTHNVINVCYMTYDADRLTVLTFSLFLFFFFFFFFFLLFLLLIFCLLF